jgi:predicted DNA-binding protein
MAKVAFTIEMVEEVLDTVEDLSMYENEWENLDYGERREVLMNWARTVLSDNASYTEVD